MKLDFYSKNIRSNFKHDGNQAMLEYLDEVIEDLTSKLNQEIVKEAKIS